MKRIKLPEWKTETSITLRVVDGDAVLYVHVGLDSRSGGWVAISVATSNLIETLEDVLTSGQQPQLVSESRTLENARRAGDKHARKWLRERAARALVPVVEASPEPDNLSLN